MTSYTTGYLQKIAVFATKENREKLKSSKVKDKGAEVTQTAMNEHAKATGTNPGSSVVVRQAQPATKAPPVQPGVMMQGPPGQPRPAWQGPATPAVPAVPPAPAKKGFDWGAMVRTMLNVPIVGK